MSRFGYLVFLLGAALFLDLLVYLGSDGFECDTPQGGQCSAAADVSGVLFLPLLAVTAIGVLVVIARRRGSQ